VFWASGISTPVVERGRPQAPAAQANSDLGKDVRECRGTCYHLGAQTSTRMESTPMKAIELVGTINEQHRLEAYVPEELPVGAVRLILLLPDKDDSNGAWIHAIAKEWMDELRDSRQDLYTLEDGQPLQ
jgi:hypothetical protein